MAFETETESRRSIGGAIAAAVVGVVLGGGITFAAGAAADNTQLPSAEEIAVNKDSAFMGSVQYGDREGRY